MPPFVQPQSLYNVSLSCVNQVVNRACDVIQRLHGDYDQPECQAQVKSLQDFLLSYVPGVLVDEIAGDKKFSTDSRVKLALLMHPSMRTFSAAMTWENRVILDDFWMSKFAHMHRLVILDLHLLCTDEILKIVSDNCPLLEDINIVSKVENCRSETPKNFNALRLNLFVSDVGLGHLVKCQKLRRITTNKMLRSHCGGRKMTDLGLRTLVRGLPKLQLLRYEDMGLVVAGVVNDVSQLALTFVCDNHPTRITVEAVTKLCPRLHHYILRTPYVEYQTILEMIYSHDEIVTALAESSSFPAVLELQHFYFSDAISNLIRVKGSALTSLYLYTVNMIGVTELLNIGEICLGLETLQIKGLGSKLLKDSVNRWISDLSMGIPLYRRLKRLYLSGKKWKPVQVLDLFMMSTQGLTSLTVWNSLLSIGNPVSLDDFVMKYQFPELQSANFCPGCPLSLFAVRSFIYKCPKLTQIMIFEHDDLKPEHIEPLQNELRSKNLNIELTYFREFMR